MSNVPTFSLRKNPIETRIIGNVQLRHIELSAMLSMESYLRNGHCSLESMSLSHAYDVNHSEYFISFSLRVAIFGALFES